MDEAQETKAGKYCPVCEKVYRESLDFCPTHPTVLMVRVRDWGEGFKIFITKSYDESDDDFLMDEGLDRARARTESKPIMKPYTICIEETA